jgi:hypothetical protein
MVFSVSCDVTPWAVSITDSESVLHLVGGPGWTIEGGRCGEDVFEGLQLSSDIDEPCAGGGGGGKSGGANLGGFLVE